MLCEKEVAVFSFRFHFGDGTPEKEDEDDEEVEEYEGEVGGDETDRPIGWRWGLDGILITAGGASLGSTTGIASSSEATSGSVRSHATLDGPARLWLD